MAKRRRKPQPQFEGYRADLARLARRGDLSALIDEFSGPHAFATVAQEKQVFFQMALESCAKKGGTAGMIEAVFRHIIAFDAQFLLRVQTQIREKMAPSDRRTFQMVSPPSQVVAEDLDRLMAVEDRIITLSKAYGTLKHVLSYSDGKKTIPRMRTRSGDASSRIIQLPVAKEQRSGAAL